MEEKIWVTIDILNYKKLYEVSYFCLRYQIFSCRLSFYMILGILQFLSIILLRMFLFPNSPEASCKRQTLRDTQTPLSGFLQFIVTEL